MLIRQFENSLRQTHLGITDDQILELRDKDFSGWIKQQVSLLTSIEHKILTFTIILLNDKCLL